MGFINSATTVTVQAYLTKRGKQILHERAANASGPLITKFALGDSDTDYNAIEAGYGPLDAGVVPESSEWTPAIRSFAIANGTYFPGTPLIIINDQATQFIATEMLINYTQTSELTFNVRTEWPANTSYSEQYKIDIINPSEVSEETFNKIFTIDFVSENTLKIRYNANAGGVIQLTGIASITQISGVDFSVVITGKETNASTTINVDVRLP